MEIPFIVTEDLSSTPAIHVDSHEEATSSALPTTSTGHAKRPSDPSLLSPGILKPGRRSFDTTASEDEVRGIPPSPTLSAQSSVHFKTSMALRDNKPGDGTTSLTLLSPQDQSRSHSRRPSNATTTSTDEGTVADHPLGLSHLYPANSVITTSARSAIETIGSPTPTHVGSVSDIGDHEKRMQNHKKARKKAKGSTDGTPEGEGEDNDEDKAMELDLTQDEHIDPAPFAFKPYHLASLVDPKNLDALEAMGGTKGLLTGLGVDPNTGLNVGGSTPDSGETPTVVVTDPAGEKGEAVKIPHGGGAYSGTVEDRQRVYGSNVLPVRKSKSLLQLMWLALKDKVLVSPSHSYVY